MPTPSSGFDLLILDCDGVVVDSEPITIRVLAEMLNELGLAMPVDEVALAFTGHTFARTLELAAERLAAPLPPDFAPHYRDRTFAALEAELQAVPGIAAALDRLTLPYCIASNGPHGKMRKTLGITGLLPRFEGRLFSAADVARGKPFPDLFLHAARHFNVSPSACLVIEDSPSGIQAAVSAGMSAYGYSDGSGNARLFAAGAQHVFSDMAELPALIDAGRRCGTV